MPFFTRKKYSAGIDIREKTVRFLEISRKGRIDEVESFGEVTDEQGIFSGEKLLKCLTDIRKILKSEKVVVSLPEGKSTPKNFDILEKAGFKNFKLGNSGKALISSCTPKGAGHSFLIVDVSEEETLFSISHGRKFDFYSGGKKDGEIFSNLNEIYTDFYKKHKEKITHVLFSGRRAISSEFLDHARRETNIPIIRANIFCNLNLNSRGLPIITKDESLAYAVAIGLALS